jgi:hypothetical protein
MIINGREYYCRKCSKRERNSEKELWVDYPIQNKKSTPTNEKF